MTFSEYMNFTTLLSLFQSFQSSRRVFNLDMKASRWYCHIFLMIIMENLATAAKFIFKNIAICFLAILICFCNLALFSKLQFFLRDVTVTSQIQSYATEQNRSTSCLKIWHNPNFQDHVAQKGNGNKNFQWHHWNECKNTKR